MFQRTWKRRLMLCLIIIGIVGIYVSAYAQAPQAVGDKELIGLVDRLEDPQKRARTHSGNRRSLLVCFGDRLCLGSVHLSSSRRSVSLPKSGEFPSPVSLPPKPVL